jgi:hypothetical protein
VFLLAGTNLPSRAGGRHRKAQVGNLRGLDYLTVGERMGGEDQGGELLEEHGAIKAVASVLKEEALLPVLLTLAREQ